jgi:ABC-type transport system involved in cytochrome bd biosynthesis fused ATPase/permease subunit
MKGRTSFLIAHRLASAVDADVIVVLDRGKIVEVGSHAELVKRAGVYSQLFNEQTRKLRLTPDHIARVPGSLSPATASGVRTE